MIPREKGIYYNRLKVNEFKFIYNFYLTLLSDIKNYIY